MSRALSELSGVLRQVTRGERARESERERERENEKQDRDAKTGMLYKLR